MLPMGMPFASLTGNWPTDWIILGALAVFIAAECWRSGSNRAASLALALPFSFLAMQALGHAAFLGSILLRSQAPIAEAITFLGLIGLAYFFVHRILGFFSDSSGAPVQSLIAGIATAILLVVFWLQVPALASLWHFGPQVQAVFADQYRFWWMIGAYFALAYART